MLLFIRDTYPITDKYMQIKEERIREKRKNKNEEDEK